VWTGVEDELGLNAAPPRPINRRVRPRRVARRCRRRRARRLDRARRRLGVWRAGNSIWTVAHYDVPSAPFASWADAGWLAFYPFA
jgi:hypothetical protein